MRFTVFTATYNRAYTLKKLYDSLLNQTYKDFEWVVVDDGSTDDTEALVNSFINENLINIAYIKTPNGGKHRAINKGVAVANGEMFFIVDSDDELPPFSLEKIDSIEKSIPKDEKSNFCGVCGLKGYDNNTAAGTTYIGSTLDITTLERYKHNITGDKSEVLYTNILSKYPFPEFENEKFITECVVWDRIAYDGYKFRFFNDIVYICEYLPDGLSLNLDKNIISSPKGYGLYLHQASKFKKINGISKWTSYYNFYKLLKDKSSTKEIASYLNYNYFPFLLRIIGIKLFYKIYDN